MEPAHVASLPVAQVNVAFVVVAWIPLAAKQTAKFCDAPVTAFNVSLSVAQASAASGVVAKTQCAAEHVAKPFVAPAVV